MAPHRAIYRALDEFPTTMHWLASYMYKSKQPSLPSSQALNPCFPHKEEKIWYVADHNGGINRSERAKEVLDSIVSSQVSRTCLKTKLLPPMRLIMTTQRMSDRVWSASALAVHHDIGPWSRDPSDVNAALAPACSLLSHTLHDIPASHFSVSAVTGSGATTIPMFHFKSTVITSGTRGENPYAAARWLTMQVCRRVIVEEGEEREEYTLTGS